MSRNGKIVFDLNKGKIKKSLVSLHFSFKKLENMFPPIAGLKLVFKKNI